MIANSTKRFSLLVVLPAFVATATASAQVRDFPYDAEVVIDSAYVRSGPTESHYPTMQLTRGARVTVRRHDPGGWFVIEPPEGSFSWIAEEHIRKLSDTEGEVLNSGAVVFVGSDFGNEASVWQRRMMSGEKVMILGSRNMDVMSGNTPITKAMLKIAPVKREYRWIRGTALLPASDAEREQHDLDPYQIPSNARRTPAGPPATAWPTQSPAAGVPLPQETGGPAVRPSPQLTRIQTIRKEQEALRDLDDRFRSMVRRVPSEWDLDSVEADYRKLQSEATWTPLVGQIDLRFPALDRYRVRQAKILDFERLTAQTEKRDAELMAMQYGLPSDNSMSAQTPTDYSTRISMAPGITADIGNLTGPVSPIPDSAFISPNQVWPPTDVGTASPGPPSMTIPGQPLSLSESFDAGPFGSSISPGDSQAFGPTDTVTPEASASEIQAGSRYIGAGVLQRAVRSGDEAGPRFVLTTPAGKILARVAPAEEANGLQLDEYVGQEVGLHGSRWFRDDLKSDYIEASGLEPVRLRQ